MSALPLPRQRRSRARATVLVGAALALALPTLAAAQDSGRFGGVRLDGGTRTWSFTAPGLKLGQAIEYTRGRELANTAFGGYQFENGVAFGAALNATPSGVLHGDALGLRFDGMRWRGDARPNLNVDVVSAFNWRNSLSVFGKFGVGRSDARAVPDWVPPPTSSALALDRPSLSYGLGVRYDINSSLGLKLELTRGTRFGLDRLRTDVDPDAVNFGLRWSF
ncbi:MAG: porin family protein [Burkholderiales bacterium]|nr:porin family protein [Burkholderiales bacterium]